MLLSRSIKRCLPWPLQALPAIPSVVTLLFPLSPPGDIVEGNSNFKIGLPEQLFQVIYFMVGNNSWLYFQTLYTTIHVLFAEH